MLKLVRGVNLTIDHAAGGRLRFGAPDQILLSQTAVTLWVTVGEYFDAASGFVVNVCDIDKMLKKQLREQDVTIKDIPGLFEWTREAIGRALPQVKTLALRADLHDNLRIVQEGESTSMLQLTRKYEIAAAHRLNNPDWDAAKNRAVFGKCNNPAGHGHTYTLEVTVAGTPDPQGGQVIDPTRLDAAVKESILDRFDHKYLNQETEEFKTLNPTVENMARVFWDLLHQHCAPARLAKIGLWETPKTYAEYSGPPA